MLRWPRKGSAIKRNRSSDIKARISIETSEELTASVPISVHCHDVIQSSTTLKDWGVTNANQSDLTYL